MSDLKPTRVENDVVVSLAYTLTVDGQLYDSSDGHEPFAYLHGHRNIIPGLEKALVGLAAGESREVLVSPSEGYGEFDPESLIDMDRELFPEGYEPQVGAFLHVRGDDGHVHTACIHEIHDKSITLDLNHPLAGKDLLFKATVLDLRAATAEELQHGHIHHSCEGCGSGGGCDSEGCGSGCC
jgi:FKBP-type peptidyl-prolyl cis-trans isomerase SlyD